MRASMKHKSRHSTNKARWAERPFNVKIRTESWRLTCMQLPFPRIKGWTLGDRAMTIAPL